MIDPVVVLDMVDAARPGSKRGNSSGEQKAPGQKDRSRGRTDPAFTSAIRPLQTPSGRR